MMAARTAWDPVSFLVAAEAPEGIPGDALPFRQTPDGGSPSLCSEGHKQTAGCFPTGHFSGDSRAQRPLGREAFPAGDLCAAEHGEPIAVVWPIS